MNTITVFKDEKLHTRFEAPGQKIASLLLWLFLAENLKAGFNVELVIEGGQPITTDSGRAVDANRVAEVRAALKIKE